MPDGTLNVRLLKVSEGESKSSVGSAPRRLHQAGVDEDHSREVRFTST